MLESPWWRRLALATLVLLLALVAVGWWRMGRVIVEVDAGALPSAPPKPAAVEFSAIAYNVQARPFMDDTGAKFQVMSPLLNAYDFVGIQECFFNHDDLWEGTDHPVRIYQGDLRHPFKVVGSGLSILGKHPLEGVESMHFSVDGDFQNTPASKGVLMAHFRVGGLPLDIYTTHFAAGKKEDSVREKPMQTREAVEFVREHSPPEHAVIFLGDFNMQLLPPEQRMSEADLARGQRDYANLDREQCLQVLTAALGLRNAMDEYGGEIFDVPDQILFRSGTEAELALLSFRKDEPLFYYLDGQPLSDHEPLIARFRISPPGTGEVSTPASE